MYGRIDSPEVIDAYVSEVEMNLRKAGIVREGLMRFHVMNVGTGRKALASSNLGAKKASHFDLGKENAEGILGPKWRMMGIVRNCRKSW